MLLCSLKELRSDEPAQSSYGGLGLLAAGGAALAYKKIEKKVTLLPIKRGMPPLWLNNVEISFVPPIFTNDIQL